MTDNSSNLKRKNPPAFPLGIRAGISDEIIIVDLIDPELDDEIFYSFTLSKSTAQTFHDYLVKFLNTDNT